MNPQDIDQHDRDFIAVQIPTPPQRAQIEKLLIKFETPSSDGEYTDTELEALQDEVLDLRRRANSVDTVEQRENDHFKEQTAAIDVLRVFEPDVAIRCFISTGKSSSSKCVPDATGSLILPLVTAQGTPLEHRSMDSNSSFFPTASPLPIAPARNSLSAFNRSHSQSTALQTVPISRHSSRKESFSFRYTSRGPSNTQIRDDPHIDERPPRAFEPPKFRLFSLRGASDSLPQPQASSCSPNSIPGRSSILADVCNSILQRRKRDNIEDDTVAQSPSKRRRVEDSISRRFEK
ncbi:hypothetical protein DL96DRAFT_1641678 [Flagelloscypha sp. PMI_526]|nr:hypothetical protein DL96DRAFT_1641678 [Flagelloscypha sp. PMI_526]